jgi:hypothetical protein
MSRFLGVVVLAFAAAGVAHSAILKPEAVEDCFVWPELPFAVRWKVEGGSLPEAVQYVVRDYAEKQVASGEAKPAEPGVIETRLTLPQGFYEIEFLATKQRFGIVALPAWKGQAEPFFAIDGALSWLVRDDATREGLVRVAKRSGIRMIRERLTWGAVQPSVDRNDWETPVKFDTLRRTCAKHGVEVLEMAHDGPAWMGRVEKYPQDLVAAARSWQSIAGHWRPTWGGLEIWNEPDIFFGGNLPADQYVPLAKAIAYGMHEKKMDVPLVGGVVAHCNREYLDAAAENGLLDCIDAFSFHTYGRAMEMEGLVAKYREWLQSQGMEVVGNEYKRIPLWITECGRPWKKGPERPPADQDADSALDIVMKGVEARACGVARYFPFVYPYYEENENNFGMMDKRATPLRSFAAYAQMIRVLQRSFYVGDLKTADKTIQRARWFNKPMGPESPSNDLVIVYTGCRDASAAVRLNVPVERVEGIDGRTLPQGPDSVPVPDGLAYVWLTRGWQKAAARPRDAIESSTAAMRLYGLKADPVPRNAPSPVVLRYLYDAALVEPKPERYRIKAVPTRSMKLAVRIFNLSDEPRTVVAALNLGATKGSSSVGKNPQLTISARSSADATWDADVANVLAREGRFKATITATTGPPPAPKVSLVLTFFGEAELLPTLQRFQHWSRLPIQQISRWTPNIAGIGKMQMDSTSEAAWRLQVKFGDGDRWVYPYFKLPDNVRMNEHTGLVIRARCHKPAEVRVFLWEGDTGVGYITPRSVIAADGQWHVAVIRFRDLVLSAANSPDPNHRLDLDQVRRISVGMNSKTADNALELSDLFVVSDKP